MSKAIESRVGKLKELEMSKDPALESWVLLFPEEAAEIRKRKLKALLPDNDEAAPDDETAPESASHPRDLPTALS